MWVAKQMGHVNLEMVMRTYGKWIPDYSVTAGYKLTYGWDSHIQFEKTHGPILAPENPFFSNAILKF